jgi:mRNA interferase HigB
MKLIGQRELARFIRRHADAHDWLITWAGTIEAAVWHSIDDLRKDYPSADGVKLKSKNVVTVFNVKGNEYRLLSYVIYPLRTVAALEILTHSDYSKNLWKMRY